jgi:ribonuclease HIII
MEVQPLTSHTCKLSDAQAASLEKHLRENDFKFRQVPYARFAAEKEKTNVVFYESGKLVVQGKGTQDFVEFVLEPMILQEVKLGYETVLNPELLAPRIGVDESGKGDFFGPLCIAAVYLNETMIPAWKNAGIRDSKNIGSDRRIAELAQLIRDTPGCVSAWCRLATRPTTGFTKMKSVNTLLAWGHARASPRNPAPSPTPITPRAASPAVTSKEDSFDLHVRDTLEAGAGLCHEDVVRGIVEEGPARIGN